MGNEAINPYVIYPVDANAITVPGLNESWNWGAWAEVIADTPAVFTLAGTIGQHATTGFDCEVQVGVGAAGLEEVFTTYASVGSTNYAPTVYTFNLPIASIAAHSRIAMRFRCGGTTGSITASVFGFEGVYESETATVAKLIRIPTGVPAVSVTPNATAWNYSSWYQVHAGLSEPCGIDAIAYEPWVAGHHEIEVGLGAAGVESIVTSIKAMAGQIRYAQQAVTVVGPVLVPANTRMSVRLRKAGTSVVVWPVALNVYGNFDPVPPPPPEEVEFPPDSDVSGETIGLTWVEFQDRSGALHVSSKLPLPDPPTFYGGWKEGEVIEWGPIRRSLSDSKGQYEGASFTWRMSDTARKWRGMLAAAATRVFLNRSVVVRMISDAVRREWQE